MPKKQIRDPKWKHYLNDPNVTVAPAVRFGNMLFISGFTGVDPSTGNLVSPNDMVAQTRQIYRNITDVLKAAGATVDNVVFTTDYITTRKDYNKTAEIRKECFGNSFPASVGIVVKELLRKDAVIEISAVCVLD